MADPKAPEMPEGWSSIGGDNGAPLSFVCERNWFVISLQRISELLSAHGLHIVSEAERKVLEACAALPEKWLLDGIAIAKNTGGTTVWLCKSELARRSGYDMTEKRRAPVQGEHEIGRKREPGTITWDEHLEAYDDYARRYGTSQSAERLAERGGFGYYELVDHLGYAPRTWEPRE